MKDFDLKGYLKNNTLLKEGIEEQEEVQEASCGNKMKRSELKEKIREEILEALKTETDDPAVGDYEEAHSGVAENIDEQEEDEDAPEADIDIDADVDIEEPAMDEPADDDPFAGAEELSDVSQVRDTAVPAWKEIGRAGQAANDEALIKMATDGLSYTDRKYPDPDPFDEQ